MNKRQFHIMIGSLGAIIGIIVFLAYIPQIFANLAGSKSQPWQPLFAAISCFVWVLYAWTKEPKRDYILMVPNITGVIFGLITFVTSL